MNAAQIYKTALEELANQGNASAALALVMGAKAEVEPEVSQVVPTGHIIAELKEANSKLHDALRTNNDSWTSSTDSYIKQAQTRILNAVALL